MDGVQTLYQTFRVVLALIQSHEANHAPQDAGAEGVGVALPATRQHGQGFFVEVCAVGFVLLESRADADDLPRVRNQVKEITLDMAGSMQKIAKTCFPRAMQVIDRFHVQKLVYEAVQELRITYRWQVIKEENKAMKAAKEKGEVYKAEELENGDTLRQLLARSRYLLFKSPDKWTKSQKIRAELLFKQFEDIKHVYYYSLELGKIFSTNYDKDVARAKLALWYNKIEEYGYDTFTTVANSIENHYERILNFFVNRSTNAAAEAFNAKIKAFRASFRGVVDMSFFLFRLAKVYA